MKIRVKIENTIERYMIVSLPFLFSMGRFIPILETIATLMTIIVLVLDQVLLKKNILKYTIIIALFVTSGMMESVYSQHIDHIKPMIIFFCAMDACEGPLYERILYHIEQYKRIIMAELNVILILNFLFMLSSAGYSSKYGESWSFSAFEGIYADPHQCAYHICALLIILLWISHFDFKQYHYFILLGYEYCVLITGARAPAVIALLIGIVFIVDHFVRPTSWKDLIQVVLRYMVLLGVVCIALYYIMTRTNFGLKILNGIGSSNFDNGRGMLRERDITLFRNSDLVHKLFGHGTDMVIKYHGSFSYSSEIWSHNDFMQILCGMGLIMLLIYVFYWLKRVYASFSESLLSVAVTSALIVVAFINGLYIHTRLTFVMPLLFIYMHQRVRLSIRGV